VTVAAPTVTDIVAAESSSEEQLLTVAAACGFGSLHPVSRAVVAEALARGIVATPPGDLQERPGLGVVATVNGRQAALGRRALLDDLAIDSGTTDDEEASQVWVAWGGLCLGRLVLRDQPRREAREALAAMRSLGITRLILLTGDRAAAARRVGDVLGMDEVVAEVLPAQKLDVVRAEQAAGHTVMMVGDGVNDAPALAGADIGVAIGAELNEVALGGADVALLGTDLGRLPQLIGLADLTRQVIGQNVWLAFGLSVALILLAARGVLDPLTGALAQSVAVLAVVANSARIPRLCLSGCFNRPQHVAVRPCQPPYRERLEFVGKVWAPVRSRDRAASETRPSVAAADCAERRTRPGRPEAAPY
jgi:cation transport ATPase